MKQTYTIQGRKFEIALLPSKNNGNVNGEAFSYQSAPQGLILNGKYIPCECVQDESGKVSSVLVHGKSIPVEIGRSPALEKEETPRSEVRAPLNGQVVRLSVRLHEQVEEGDVVLTLEAMKMENEISAPIRGTVTELNVREKEVVKAGQLLFRIERESP